MTEAAAAASVSNVSAEWGRAEERAAAGAPCREAFDVATCRALADTAVLAELVLPFVRVGGALVAAKGPAPHAEVATASAALNRMGSDAGAVGIAEVASEGPLGPRTVVTAPKVKKTPSKYPRPPSTIKKKPIR